MEASARAHGLHADQVEEVGAAAESPPDELGRKSTTITDYRSYLRVQLVPFFADKPLDKIGRVEVDGSLRLKDRRRKSPKSILNWLRLLSSVFEYAIKREWVTANPCRLVDKPRVEQDDDIRFLTQPEVEALLQKGA